MFVLTIGPIGRSWGKVLRFAAIIIVLLLIVLIAWRVLGTMTANVEQGSTPGVISETMSRWGEQEAGNFWQRWLGSLKQWFRFGF
ncbi:MAG TPA: hypothetical protein DDZ53_07565 [Firmicutes bacterium]|jgi:hypothetical protein|nr:hypothetical protein [Bacillota bacterium]